MPSDIEIAQKATMKKIAGIAKERLGIPEDSLEPFGHYKAKVSLAYLDTLKNKKYPKYDDLDEEKQYDFNLIVQLNEDIINIITYLINILRNKEGALKAFTANQNYGLNVNNFVSTFNYEVIVLSEQINLYEKYLDFFYHVHEKLLKRLITKISLLEAQLNADITFEGGLI